MDVWEWRWLLWRRRRQGVEYFMLCEEEESSMSVISTNSYAAVHKFSLLCVRLQFLRFASIQRGCREPKHSSECCNIQQLKGETHDKSKRVTLVSTDYKTLSRHKQASVHRAYTECNAAQSLSDSWYLPNRYRRKTRSVHFGIIVLAGTPFFLERGVMAPFLRGPAPFLRKKGFPAKP